MAVFGEPIDLYSETQASGARFHGFEDLSAAFDLINEHNVLFLPMQSKYVTEDLAQRVINHAKANATKVTERAAQQAASPSLVVLLTIRTGHKKLVDH